MVTPVVSSGYLCGIFWLPLLYLLITPVVSSGDSCGIFLLHLWYLLVTPVVSSVLIRRDHRCNQNIPQGKSEDITGVTRRYHRGNQKIPQG
jgi:hypothetical protein